MSTIADVAARAGVSKATASRALSGRGYVAEETRVRVQAAAAALSYVAHSAATTLATGRTHTVGVILPALDRWFFAELLTGIQEALLVTDYDLALYGLSAQRRSRTRIFEDVLPRRRFDGIIVSGVYPSPAEAEVLLRTDRPVIAVGSDPLGTGSVAIDDSAAARIATEHLIELGHRAIAFVGGERENLSGSDARRWDGYRRAMVAAGYGELVRRAPAEPTMPGGYAASAELLGDRRQRPSAVVGVCDEVAVGAIIAARRLGLTVPTEISVIGIDDHEHAEMFALTTVRQRPREQGHEAVRLLRAQWERGDAAGEHHVAASTLVVRNSTSAPR